MKFFFLAILTASYSISFAQSNYQAGKIIKLNGDTLKGYIDYREWAQNPRAVNFRAGKNDQQTLQFTPGNTRGFQIDSLETYVSYTGDISMDKTTFPELPYVLDTSKMPAAVFLRQLATGSNLTLYDFTDEIKSRFFIAETGRQPVELKYYQYYNDQRDAVERPLFRGQLQLYVYKFNAGKPGLIANANRAGYNITSLTAVVNAINGDNGGASRTNLTAANKHKAGFRLFAGAGALYTTTSYSNNSFNVQTGYGLKYSSVKSSSYGTTATANGGIDLFINPNVQQFIFRTEVSFSYLQAGLDVPVSGQTTPVNDALKFNQLAFNLVPQLLFNIYNKDDFKIFIDGGVSLRESSYNNTELINLATGVSSPPGQEFEFSAFSIGFEFKAGVVINHKFEINIQYSPNSKILPGTSEFVSNRSVGLGVKLLF